MRHHIEHRQLGLHAVRRFHPDIVPLPDRRIRIDLDVPGQRRARRAEGQAGLDDNELYKVAQTSGAGTTEVKGCIQNKSFADYIEQHTQKVLSEPQQGIQVSGTPTILVNGTQFTWATGEELVSPEFFAQFVQTASAE